MSSIGIDEGPLVFRESDFASAARQMETMHSAAVAMLKSSSQLTSPRLSISVEWVPARSMGSSGLIPCPEGPRPEVVA
ncbi:hypothetical protein DIPPA_30963 [Diplonema papillatum]|nr:hypothetical protein DIPPA_30963 [Diplonema papillatum]